MLASYVFSVCVCVARAHESREPAEETEDLSRRQFGLTDLILLSLLLVSSLPRSSPLSLRQFSSFSFSPASILSSGENSREANALLHSNCRLIFILTSYFAFKFRFENLRTRFSSNGARQNLVNSSARACRECSRGCVRTWPTREMYAIKMTFTKTFRMTFRVPRDTTSFTSRGFILLFFSSFLARVNRVYRNTKSYSIVFDNRSYPRYYFSVKVERKTIASRDCCIT